MINIAFAGFRHSHILGLYHTALQNPEVNIVCCYEQDDAARAMAEQSDQIVFNCRSYQEILDNETIEAVAIGDYYGIRGQRIIAALRAGKHVICDKPICTNLDELETIEKLVQKKNLKLCCMLDLRYMPQAAKVCELIKHGEIGDIINVSFTGQHCLDYPTRPGWYFEQGKHGGTINDIAIHGIDLVRMVTGKNLTKINCAKTWNAFASKTVQFKDCAQFMAEMDGISLLADVSYAAPKFNGILPTYWDFYFWGTKGMLRFHLASRKIHIYQHEETVIKCEPRSPEYLKDFIDEINNCTTMMNSFDLIESQRQTLKIQKASEENK